MINMSGVVPNPNQSLMDQLQATQLQAGMLGVREQLEVQQKAARERELLMSMAEQYNADPTSMSDKEVAYLNQAAPVAGIDISSGNMRDKKSAGFLKNAGTFGLGVADSVLMDLIPDKTYINRHNKGYATAGKWTGTIGSLAIGGIGAYKALSGAAKAANLSKMAMGSADDILKAAQANKNFVKVLGKDYSLGDDAVKGLYKLTNDVSSASEKTSKELLDIAEQIGVKKLSRKEFEATIVKGGQYKAANGKLYDATTAASKANISKDYSKYLESLTDPKAMLSKLPVDETEVALQIIDEATAKSIKVKQEIAELTAKLDKGVTEKAAAGIEAKLTALEKEAAELAELTSSDAAVFSKAAERVAINKELSKRITAATKRKAYIDDLIKTITDNYKREVVTSDDIVAIAKKKLEELQNIESYGKGGAKEVKKDLRKLFSKMSKEESRQVVKNAEDFVKLTSKESVKKEYGELSQIMMDLSTNKLAGRQQRAIDILKYAKSLNRKKTAKLSTFTAPGMARESIEGIFGRGGLTGMSRFTVPALGAGGVVMVASPAIRSLAPITPETAASGPYGMFNPIFAPGQMKAGMSSLPYGGMLPPIQGGQGQQEVNQMLRQ